MKKLIVVVVGVLVLVNLGAVAYRIGWLAKLPIPALARLASPSGNTPGSAPSAGGQIGGGGAAATGAAGGVAAPAGAAAAPAGGTGPAGASQPPASGKDVTGAPLIAPPPFDGNVAALDYGGTVERWTTSTNESPDHQEAIDGSKDTNWVQFARDNGPGELVFSFFAREPMLVDRVVLVGPRVTNGSVPGMFPKDVEVWVSTGQTPDDPFQKVATTTLAGVAQFGEATISFPPTEARFLKFRALNNQKGTLEFLVAEFKVMEAQRSGYVPLLTRHPELQWPGGPNRVEARAAPVAGATTAPCTATPPPTTPPSHPESRKVILLGAARNMHLAGALFARTRFPKGRQEVEWRRAEVRLDEQTVAQVDDGVPQEERGVLTRATYRFMYPKYARPAILAPAFGFDTVVMTQMCNGGSDRMKGLSPAFKQALMTWVAAGNKLIIQDSDDCTPGPDYSFIPFRFKTNNPGAQGAAGSGLRFVEENQMLQGKEGRPAFLDTEAWVLGKRHHRNELGDANTFVSWDANWCGHLTVKNVNNVTGFTLAYAHLGRGLIIYDGLDNDQSLEYGYDEMAIRELGQGFDPDNLPCGTRLGDFIISTPTPLLRRAAVAGQKYEYPLTLLSNQGYTGSVTLSAAPVGEVAGVQAKFDPATITLNGEGTSGLSVTLPSTLPTPSFALEVRGSDATGKANSLCLQFGPPTTGELAVVSTIAPPAKTGKNLEIILDASGSMKTALAGKKSRWDVALETLDEVLSGLPSDFNVGLRVYGHREASRSPKTCTDSELVVPIRKLNRNAILARAKSFKPKGETPLVYSAMQSPDDLKAVGGGTVILITDGEESCKGDTVKAAADLKASGLDIRLNIVGFAVKNPKVQKDLANFSQATGGLFYSADSGAALGDALMLAAVEKFPYTVYDSAGKVVLSGEAGGGADQLPGGEYKVVVKAGTKELVAPKVTVGLGQAVTLKIAMKKGQLVLE